MKLLRYRTASGEVGVGVLRDGEVMPVEGDLVEVAMSGATPHPAGPSVPLASVSVLAPVARPPKFLAIGLNYRDHIAETGAEEPKFPVFFNKQSTCVVGPGEAVEVPRVSAMVDFEGELGVVIGRRCRHVGRDEARGVIAGFTIVNDVTVRDWQLKAPTMTIGKSFDTHGPLGPVLVTRDEVPDPHQLRIRTLVNGEVMQDASTAEMIYDCYEQIAVLTTAFTLEPGDVIATGTPAGVGVVRNPPVFLKPGDVVRVEIERIGALENPVVAEPDPAHAHAHAELGRQKPE